MSFCAAGGMPVIGSSLALRREMVHEGVMRLSEEEAVAMIRSGTSWTVSMGGGVML